MRILVTGGCGFVGSQLIQLLAIHTDYDVHILDNELSGKNPNPAVFHINRDIRDAASMKAIIPTYDLVIHLAGIVGVPACSIDEQFSFDVNVKGTENIVHNLRPDAKIIFTSSTSAYGNKVNELVTEETKLTPLTNYGFHKLYSETEIKRHTDNYIIVRPATAFGISQRTRLDVLPNTLIYDALTKPHIEIFEPHVIRPFIHVYDFASILLYAAQDRMAWKNIYNIGDRQLTMQKGDLARNITKRANTSFTLREGKDPDQRNYDISFQKLYNTGYSFGRYETLGYTALDYAFDQISNNIEEIKANYNSYNTPYHVERYLKQHGSNSY